MPNPGDEHAAGDIPERFSPAGLRALIARRSVNMPWWLTCAVDEIYAYVDAWEAEIAKREALADAAQDVMADLAGSRFILVRQDGTRSDATDLESVQRLAALGTEGGEAMKNNAPDMTEPDGLRALKCYGGPLSDYQHLLDAAADAWEADLRRAGLFEMLLRQRDAMMHSDQTSAADWGRFDVEVQAALAAEEKKRPWWATMGKEDIAAELSATFDLGLPLTRKIARWMLDGTGEEGEAMRECCDLRTRSGRRAALRSLWRTITGRQTVRDWFEWGLGYILWDTWKIEIHS